VRALVLSFTGALLAGCRDACRAPDDLLEGQLVGTLGGASWTAEGVGWSEASEALSVNVDRTDGYTMSLVAHTALDGSLAVDLLAAGNAPFDVPLGNGDDGNWVNVYVQGETATYSTIQGTGGSLAVAAIEGDVLLGCLDFGAANTAGESLSFEEGRFRIGPR
jgi:hypothetical protein